MYIQYLATERLLMQPLRSVIAISALGNRPGNRTRPGSAAAWRAAVAGMVLGGLAAAAPAAEVPRVSAGYFIAWGVYDRNYHVTNVPAAYITHINYAFAQPVCYASNSAALVLGDSYADIDKFYPGDSWDPGSLRGSFHQLIRLKQRYPHVRTLISAGGWTWSDHFSDIAAYAGARTSFIESCVTFITNYQFDGIDIDWEYPVEGGEDGLPHRPDDAGNFLLLLQGLRQRLDQQTMQDGRPYLITAAISAGPLSLTNRYHLREMSDLLDWFNVMTYDFAGTWDTRTGHNAPLGRNPLAPTPNNNITATLQVLLSNNVPARRIVLGLPFYGHSFAGVPTNGAGLFQTFGSAGPGSWEAGQLDFNDLAEDRRSHGYIDGYGYTRHGDPLAGVPWLYNPTSQVFVTYDDADSIALKASAARDLDLRGVMFWSMDMDTRDYALHKSIYRVLYPMGISAGSSGVALEWFAWTGAVYTVAGSTNLVANVWAPCPNLANELGQPCGSVTGANAVVRLLATNTPPVGTPVFFRWHLLPPP